MIARIRRGLIQHTDRFSVQSSVLSFEANVTNPGHILFAEAVVVLKEEGDRGRRVPVRPVHRDLCDIGCLWKLEILDW